MSLMHLTFEVVLWHVSFMSADVAVGATIAFMSQSRSAPEERNLFQCEYVYAGLGKEKGWIPVDILDNLD